MPVNSNAHAGVDGWFARLGRALLPPLCLICGESGSDGHDLCVQCLAALPWNRAACSRCGLPMPESVAVCGRCLRKPPPLDRVHAAFRYGFPVDRLLPRFKFHHDLAAGRELAEAMRASLAESLWHSPPLPAPDQVRGRLFGHPLPQGERENSIVSVALPQALIAVPLHSRRLRERGYNQALELARPLANTFAIPLLREGLRRVRDIAPQTGLGALARRRNPRGAFAIGSDTLPEHVALVDDVMTTGATLYECARVLRRAGVRRVDAWIAARVASR